MQEALECPCVADLKNGSCGAPFVSGQRVTYPLLPPLPIILAFSDLPVPPTNLTELPLGPTLRAQLACSALRLASAAFGCYIRSSEEIKGSDCVAQFVAMQECITKHEAEFKAFGEELEVNEKAFIAEREAQRKSGGAT